ncbi:STAS domain-containing protein [Inquilinus sp. NPDC058860]|uniref:STAS domain-containing protein n=1 Tax=Inquilinus sp. NPDC058860 TaxID=3346652 RepID=UPI00369C4211
MDITKREKDGVTILELKGDSNVDITFQMRSKMELILESGARKIVLNLSGVTRLDSPGLGALVGALENTEKLGGRLKLAAISSKAYDILVISRLLHVFYTYDTEDEAIKSFA